MQWSNEFDRNQLNRRSTDRHEHNRTVMLNAAAVFAICCALASFMPRELFTASLSLIAFFAALGALIAALLYGEHPLADRLTRFDVAAAFLLLSIALSWTVDPETLRAYAEAHAHAAGQGAATGQR